MNLPKAIQNKILRLTQNGESFVKQASYREAVQEYSDALALLPKPITNWEPATWLLVAIGDANFLAKRYEQARMAFTDAMLCPGAVGNPFIHMRLGQTEFELGNMYRAADELTRAYLSQGKAIFRYEDPKYLAFARSKPDPQPRDEARNDPGRFVRGGRGHYASHGLRA